VVLAKADPSVLRVLCGIGLFGGGYLPVTMRSARA